MKNSIFFILIVILFFFLMFKAVKFLFPLMIPVLIFLGIFIFLSALFRSKKEMPPKNTYRGEVVKDVEIRVIDEKETSAENTTKKENS
jgi:hypothetical protein